MNLNVLKMINIPLNNKLADAHCASVKNYIISRIRKITLSKTQRLIKNNVPIPLSASNKTKLEELLKDGVLDTIIKAKPNELLDIINSYSDYNSNNELSKFVYNIFVKHGYENIDKYNFIKKIGLNTCPYCNRSYVYTLSKSKKLKPEIDHFYPKSKYPILAISYYNLIPSCPTCNGFGAKENQDPIAKGMKSPYEINDGEFKFSFEIKDTAILNPLTNVSSDAINVFLEKEILGNTEAFHLDELYKEHYDVIHELYIKSKHEYTKTYIEQLKEVYSGFSEVDINRLIIGNYTNKMISTKDH